MSLCKMCFREVSNEIVVPSWHPDEKAVAVYVHRECLAERTLALVRDDPDKGGLLRYLVEFEESRAPEEWSKSVSGGTADASWDWQQVGIPTVKIMPLVNAGLVGTVYSSRSATYYSLVGRDVIKSVLTDIETARHRESILPVTEKELEIPADLFSAVFGYEDIKAFLKRVLRAERFHVLFLGPPASAKTVFLLELARLPGSFYCLGSATTKAGIAEVLCEQQPRLFLVDEIDKFESKDLAVLLSLAETGIVKETKVSKQREVRLDTNIFAAANSSKGMPRELLSRFRVLYLPEYSKDEFVSAATNLLVERQKMAPDLASYIAENAWEVSGDVREAVRIGKICRSREEVDSDIGLMAKYGRIGVTKTLRQ